MNKKYYVEKYNEFWDKCLEDAKRDIKENDAIGKVYPEDIATEIFEETANVEQVVGYYVSYHGDSALKDWLANTECLEFTEQDMMIDKILKAISEKDRVLI